MSFAYRGITHCDECGTALRHNEFVICDTCREKVKENKQTVAVDINKDKVSKYKGYELIQAIAEGKIKKGSKFIFRYKDNYEENVVWNSENFCYIDNDGYLLKDVSDCELIYGNFELIEDEEIDIQSVLELKEINDRTVTTYADFARELNNVIVRENTILNTIKQLDKRTRKENIIE